jgi:hypothetical protein
VANAYKIKHTPGRNTNISDSESISELYHNGIIEPLRIFPKYDRELKRLTIARDNYVKLIAFWLLAVCDMLFLPLPLADWTDDMSPSPMVTLWTRLIELSRS